MDAVGNDIVWLADPANVGRHADFRLIQRILAPSEQAFVEVATDADRVLWALWAAKEAAYKAWSRLAPRTSFSPVSFEVRPTKIQSAFLLLGVVDHDGQGRTVSWQHGPDWVHAVVTRDPSTVRTKIEAGLGGESEAVRSLAVRTLVEAGMPQGTVEGHPPRYLVGGQETEVELSLSHDGPYLAVAVRCRRWTAALQP